MTMSDRHKYMSAGFENQWKPNWMLGLKIIFFLISSITLHVSKKIFKI